VTSISGGGNKSSVGVLVERTSRLVLLARMRQGLTYDQGKELSRHARLADASAHVCEDFGQLPPTFNQIRDEAKPGSSAEPSPS